MFNVLAPLFEVWIVNASHLKQVPGRKTDVKDAEWIAQLMGLGLLHRSFIPDVAQRDLRDLTRYRTRLLGERASAANRLQKILEDANIKLASVASNVQGVSARAMLEAMIRGETDAAVLADLAVGRLRSKLPELEAALRRPHPRPSPLHVGPVAAPPRPVERGNRHSRCTRFRILTAPHEASIQRLDAIPGVDRRTAEVIFGRDRC